MCCTVDQTYQRIKFSTNLIQWLVYYYGAKPMVWSLRYDPTQHPGYSEIVRLELSILWIIGKVWQTEDCRPGGKLAYSGENDQVTQILGLFPLYLCGQINKQTDCQTDSQKEENITKKEMK